MASRRATAASSSEVGDGPMIMHHKARRWCSHPYLVVTGNHGLTVNGTWGHAVSLNQRGGLECNAREVVDALDVPNPGNSVLWNAEGIGKVKSGVERGYRSGTDM